MGTKAVAGGFREARRELGGTASLEKGALQWLAARMPAFVEPDHLTALGFAATLAAGAKRFRAMRPAALRFLLER